MAVFKCKMCGGDLNVTDGMTVVECEFCDTKQTVTSSRDEVVNNLFNRANNLRLKCEFDKAQQVYEKILNENDGDAEAHWGAVLCKYGIEYVEDPKTYKRIPTCHRTLYESILKDVDYIAAVENADAKQKVVYEQEAIVINEIQKGILNIVKNEKPFDVFICYKEADETGKRTMDSTIANDIYYQLTTEGLKVFYAPITLSERLVGEFEPYIFAALNSAKVMIVLATKVQYFDAVWVKNEWSRFLKLAKTDRSKLVLPCYLDMDAYDLPEDFAHLQKYDMSKIGFIADLVRGIKKVVISENPEAKAAPSAENAAKASVATLLKRAKIFLEDKNWKSADEYCEKVLDIDPENAEAYVCKLMVDLHVSAQTELVNCLQPFDNNINYGKAVRYAEDDLANTLKRYVEDIKIRNKNQSDEATYHAAVEKMNSATTEDAFKSAATLFASISGVKDAADLQKKCLEKAEESRKNEIYNRASAFFQHYDFREVAKAKELFLQIPGWKDADTLAALVDEKTETMRKTSFVEARKGCLNETNLIKIDHTITELRELNGWPAAEELAQKLEQHLLNLQEKERLAQQKEREREEQRRQAAIEAERKHKEEARRKKTAKIMKVAVAAILIVAVIGTASFFIYKYGFQVPAEKYSTAIAYVKAGKYDDAIALFDELGSYKDSKEKIPETKYKKAEFLLKEEKVEEACLLFAELGNEGYADSKEQRASIVRKHYNLAEVGDIIVFGSYEQDNDKQNGKEEIEWQVLAKDESGLTVISNVGLDFQPYAENSNGYHVDWKDCSLRKWLNNEFLGSAFTKEEAAFLATPELKTGENLTADKVFLLDSTEEPKPPKDVVGAISEYAKYLSEQDDLIYSAKPNDPCYWLRTHASGGGAYVRDTYDSYSYSSLWTYARAYVRPSVKILFE